MDAGRRRLCTSIRSKGGDGAAGAWGKSRAVQYWDGWGWKRSSHRLLTRSWLGRGCVFEGQKLLTCLGNFMSFTNTKPFHFEFHSDLSVKKCWNVWFYLENTGKKVSLSFQNEHSCLKTTACGRLSFKLRCDVSFTRFFLKSKKIPVSHFHSKGKQVYGGIDIFCGVEVTPRPATAKPTSLLVSLFLLRWFRCWKMIVGREGKRPRLVQPNYNPAEMASRNSARTNLIMPWNSPRKRKIIASLYPFKSNRLSPSKVKEQCVLNTCNAHKKPRGMGSGCRIEQPKHCVSGFLIAGQEDSKIIVDTRVTGKCRAWIC